MHAMRVLSPATSLTVFDRGDEDFYVCANLTDVVFRLHDTRLKALECKVSNSATNSVKRLNNDAAFKDEYWIKQFGAAQVVPAAVLAGVFKVLNL